MTDLAAEAAQRRNRRRLTPWVAVAGAVFCIGWGGNQFTPLLIAYAQMSGFTRIEVNVLLGAYVVGLVPGLLVASALSDEYGRRGVMALGLLSSAIGSVTIAVGESLGFGLLFAGRVLSGMAVGIAMAVGSAWIIELSSSAAGVNSRGVGPRRAAISLSLGFGAGPLCAGLLAAFAPMPLTLAYIVHAALCLPALWALLRRTERTRSTPTTDSFWQRLKVPSATHRRFRHVVVPMAPWVFGSAGIAYAVMPALVADALGEWALLYTTALTVLTLGCGVLIQPIARRLDDPSSARAIVVSMVLMAAGLCAAVATAITRSPLIALFVAMLLGSAYGIALVSGLLEIQRIAEPHELAGLSGVYYSVAYLGFLLPAVLAALAQFFTYPVMLAALAVVAVGCAIRCASGWSKHLNPKQRVRT